MKPSTPDKARPTLRASPSTSRRLKRPAQLDLDTVNRVCHDLGQPLAVVRAFADLLLDEVSGPLNADQRSEACTILVGAHVAALQVTNLVHWAQLAAGEMRLELERTSLVDLLEELVATQRVTFQRTGLALLVKPEGDRMELDVDVRRLETVLGLLIERSYRFCSENERVTLVVRRESGFIQVEISGASGDEDGGRSGPSEIEDLGFSVCRGTVERMGGSLRIDGSLQRGAQIVHLPVDT